MAFDKYDQAKAIYIEIAESKPTPDRLAWAHMQIGNCARKTGDFLGALAAYRELMNKVPDSSWAEEAAWWTSEIKWWSLWNETMRNESGPVGP